MRAMPHDWRLLVTITITMTISHVAHSLAAYDLSISLRPQFKIAAIQHCGSVPFTTPILYLGVICLIAVEIGLNVP